MYMVHNIDSIKTYNSDTNRSLYGENLRKYIA